jgi:anti-anti-sigma factor
MRTMETQTGSVDRGFSISCRRLEEGLALDLSGDVDIATAPIVEDELLRAEQSEDLIVLNLHDVNFMDSTGIRMVIAADQRLRERGASLRIVNVPGQVHKLFKLVGVLDHLGIDGGPASAEIP